MLHAWFSEKQIKNMKRNKVRQKQGVYKIYVKENGEEVCASMVSNTMDHGCNFDDIIYLGKVSKFVRCEKEHK